MGCTHSKNSKSKAAKAKNEHPLDRSSQNNPVPHFDETQPTTLTTSHESDETHQKYSKNLLNETGAESTVQKSQVVQIREKSAKKAEPKPQATTHIQIEEKIPVRNQDVDKIPEPALEKMESIPHTAIPPSKNFVASTYYPMPIVAEKQKSPEKKKLNRVAKTENQEEKMRKKKELPPKEKSTMIGPNYRPQLTPEDLEYIRRSVQQRNERRAYMMAHRNETDDTLYELEVRMPEKDYTHRFENSRVY